MSAWISAWAALVAATIPLVGAIYTFTTNRRAQYDRVLALASESGTAPISVDRHVIGTAFEPLSKLPNGQPVTLTDAQIQSLFNVLWYAQRVDAFYVSLRSPLRPDRITRTQALLLDSLATALGIWRGYVALNLVDAAEREIPIAGSDNGLLHLAKEYDRLSAIRQRKDHVTQQLLPTYSASYPSSG